MIYQSTAEYVNSAQSLQDKIARIDAVITLLLDNMAVAAAGNAEFKEYSLDDGQTRIRAVYNTIVDIERSIYSFERLKQLYINQLNGRITRLIDGRNFN